MNNKFLKMAFAGFVLTLSGFANASFITETIDVGSHDRSFNLDIVRGFWFTAPVNFWIVGIDVPTEASAANFDTSIFRLSSPPPAYSSTTTDFDILYEVRDQSTAIMDLAIEIFAGDIIGVLGSRGGITSYNASSPYSSSILGNTVSLKRLGSQNSIGSSATVAGMGVWQQTFDPIGRINLTISDSAGASLVPEPSTLAIFALGLMGLASRRFKKKS